LAELSEKGKFTTLNNHPVVHDYWIVPFDPGFYFSIPQQTKGTFPLTFSPRKDKMNSVSF
jgi:hypothetical protein